MTDDRFFIAGGTLEADAPCYVERRADRELSEALSRGEICYALTSRQMGKSSLMVRTVERLRDEGWSVVTADLTTVGQNLTPEQWYYGLLTLLSRQLGLRDEMREYWRDREQQLCSPVQRWLGALREGLLPRCRRGLILFIDEIDFVRSLPFPTHEFFAAIRGSHNDRLLGNGGPRLVFCLLGAASPAELIADPAATPFNVGRRIELGDFAPEDCRPLEIGLRLGTVDTTLRSEAEARRLLRRVLYWTGGHPYLTQKLCSAVAEAPEVRDARGVDRVCRGLFLEPGAADRDDNLHHLRERLLRDGTDGEVFSRYRALRRGARIRESEADSAGAALRLVGVAAARGGYLQVRNRIYARIFDPQWINDHVRAEARQIGTTPWEPARPRTGFLGTAAPLLARPRATRVSSGRQPRISAFLSIATGVALLAVLGVVLTVLGLGLAAERRRTALHGYADQLGEAVQALRTSDFDRARGILDSTPAPLREWYWQHLRLQCEGSAARFQTGGFPLTALHFVGDTHDCLTTDDSGQASLWDRHGVHQRGSNEPLIGEQKEKRVRFTGGMLSRRGERVAFVVVPLSSTKPPPSWTLFIRDLISGQVWSVPGTRSNVDALAFDPTGEQIAIATSGGTRNSRLERFRWDGARWTRTAQSFPYRIAALAYSWSGSTLALGGTRGEVQTLRGNRARSLQVAHPVAALEFSPDDRFLAVGAGKGRAGGSTVSEAVTLLPLTGGPGRIFLPVTDPITDLSFSRSGERLAVATSTGSASVWNWRTAQEVASVREGGAYLTAVELSSDHEHLVVADARGRVEAWNLNRPLPTRVRPDQEFPAESSNGEGEDLLCSADARLSRDAQGNVIFQVSFPRTATVRLSSGYGNPPLALSADGQAAAVGVGPAVCLLRRGEREWRRLAAPRSFRSLAISADGRTLAGADDSGEIQLWDVRSGCRLGSLPALPGLGRGGLKQLRFTPSGTLLGHAGRLVVEWVGR